MAHAKIYSDDDVQYLRGKFYYCPLTGIMHHKANVYSGAYNGFLCARAGDPILNKDRLGYMHVRFGRKSMLVHRLAWILMHGNIHDPSLEIDHVNGIRSDNRLCNLRLVSKKANMQNQHNISKSNRSGHVGVYWYKAKSKWTAQIRTDGKLVSLGYFPADRIEDAIAARLEAKRRLHTRIEWDKGGKA